MITFDKTTKLITFRAKGDTTGERYISVAGVRLPDWAEDVKALIYEEVTPKHDFSITEPSEGPWRVSSIHVEKDHEGETVIRYINIADARNYHVAKVSSKASNEVFTNAHILAASYSLYDAMANFMEYHKANYPDEGENFDRTGPMSGYMVDLINAMEDALHAARNPSLDVEYFEEADNGH